MTSPPSTQRSRTARLLRQTEELSFLNAISTAVSGTLDLSQLLNMALERIIALTGTEGGAALLVDEDTQRLTLVCERNLPSAGKEALLRKPVSVGELIPGITAQRCELLVVEDAKDDEREIPSFREAGIMTHVCIPLAVRGKALGVMGMIDRRSRQFGPSELALFTSVGEQLGIAIDRARLFEKQAKLAERLRGLNGLMRIATSTLDMAEIFEQVGDQVKQLIDHDRMSIAMRPTDADYVELYAVAAKEELIFPQGTRAPLHETPMGEVILTGRPILRRNWPADGVYPIESVIAKAEGYRSAMYVPLQSKGRVIGSLNIVSCQPARYSEKDLQTAQEIADHLAVVLGHALTYKKSKELAERLQTLNELMRIATSTLDMAQVFEQVGEQVKQLIDYARLSIAMRPPDADYVEMYAVVSIEGEQIFPKGTRLPLQETPMGEAILTGRPILRKNAPDDCVYPMELEMTKTIGSRSYMFVPLESKGRVIGTLNVASRGDASYSEEELRTAQEIADHLAVVLEHALLYEESKQAEEAQGRLNKQLEEASRHKSDFLASMSHELRTPLNAILGASQLLAKGRFGQLNDKEMEYVQDIHECGRDLLSLINDVLDLSKVEAGKLELEFGDFDLHSLMERSAVIIRERAANKSLDFCVVPPAENIVLEADERRIKQVVYNLLSNAVKFTPENGRVVFRAHRDGEEILFAVEDTGPGVGEEFRERIFEEFFQTPGNQEGTGLGLALSKRLVGLHGGRIWLESQVSQGSRFCFTIPIKR